MCGVVWRLLISCDAREAREVAGDYFSPRNLASRAPFDRRFKRHRVNAVRCTPTQLRPRPRLSKPRAPRVLTTRPTPARPAVFISLSRLLDRFVESVSILSVCARCPKAHKAKGTSPAQCDAQLSSSRLNDRAEGLWLLGLGVGCFPSCEARVEALRLNPIGQEIRRVAALQVDRLHEAVDDGRSV